MEKSNMHMTADTFLYMIVKIVEGIVGILTVTVYTYCFLPDEYGKYNIINVTVVTSAMISINWLAQSVMRYINEYDEQYSEFYSTVISIWAKINIVVVVIATISIFFYNILFDSNLTPILILAIFMFVTYGANLVASNILVAKRKVKLNLLISICSIVLKLISTIVLILIFGAKIEWILIPNIIFDFISVMITVLKLNIFKNISISYNSKDVLNKFLIYGIPIIGLTFSTSILYNSDRYIIKFFKDTASVGIYYANYSLMSSVFSMISNAIMKGSYPSILNAWNSGNKNKTVELISQAVRHLLIISIPAIFGISVLAESLAKLVLEPSYVEGYVVMKWVAIGMTFLGLTEYSNKYWELEVNTKIIFKYSLISGAINIILNIILIPIFGYKVAAVTTAVGFFVYFLLSFWGSRNYFRWTLKKSCYFKIILSATVMAVAIKIILNLFELSFGIIAMLVILGILIYIFCLYITGEIKQEITILKNLIRKDD